MIGSGVKLTVFLWKVESSEILLVEAFGRITTLAWNNEIEKSV